MSAEPASALVTDRGEATSADEANHRRDRRKWRANGSFSPGVAESGPHVVPYLLSHGHAVLNLDLAPLNHPGVNTVIIDLTDSGQVFNALSMHFGFDEVWAGKGRDPVDAVVHFAAIPRILMIPDNTMFATNVPSTYNVIEAATTLGVRKVIIASSETTYGVCFAEGDREYRSFPLDEDYDVDPLDSYGLSKLVGEEDGQDVRHADRRGHLCAQDRRRHRTPRIRSFPRFHR